ncbi:hypothetical protein K502DRAFT_368767 [Neoconidiobolus thromboides FSU 785]|nr:hypothetical protein K502DRAFT_368767 [Neoconidiobolus thromboides FSU 785]
MANKLRILNSCINVLAAGILGYNVFDHDGRHPLTERLIVLDAIRYIFANFIIFSEIPPMQRFYVKHFRFFMYPFGRALTYFVCALLGFSDTWYGILSTILIGLFGTFTFGSSFYFKSQTSPYLITSPPPVDEASVSTTHGILNSSYQSISDA